MNRLASFDRYLSLLFAIAYRMLGSVTLEPDRIDLPVLDCFRSPPATLMPGTERFRSVTDGTNLSILALDCPPEKLREQSICSALAELVAIGYPRGFFIA